MNKKQLYEQIMTSISKEVKKVLNESKSKKYEFSKNDLNEIEEFILNDSDFYSAYCTYANIDYYDSYEETVKDIIEFLENGLYSGDPDNDKEVHKFYILDEPDLGCSWLKLKSGKILNLDNLYTEFKGIIRQK